MSSFQVSKEYVSCYNNKFPFLIQGDLMIKDRMRGSFRLDNYISSLVRYKLLGCKIFNIKLRMLNIPLDLEKLVNSIKSEFDDVEVMLEVTSLSVFDLDKLNGTFKYLRFSMKDLKEYSDHREKEFDMLLGIMQNIGNAYIELDNPVVDERYFNLLENYDVSVYSKRKIIS